MASEKARRQENVEGKFYVDSTCINCGACYWIAPESFAFNNSMSAVYQQPGQDNEDEAFIALLSCPVNSIGVVKSEKLEKNSRKMMASFPYLLESNIYHCGFHAESSFGAASFLIKREHGNILIDSPRFVKQLEDQFKKMGGIDLYLLTHKDDVADTSRYWKSFGGKRTIHHQDVTKISKDFEFIFKYEEPFYIDNDILVIPVPGHTRGSVCYLYQNKFLFTGDHLAFSMRLNHLYAFKNACWYDFEEQIKSMEKLLDYNFEYILPGHGAPFKANKEEMKKSLKLCIDWMKS